MAMRKQQDVLTYLPANGIFIATAIYAGSQWWPSERGINRQLA